MLGITMFGSAEAMETTHFASPLGQLDSDNRRQILTQQRTLPSQTGSILGLTTNFRIPNPFLLRVLIIQPD